MLRCLGSGSSLSRSTCLNKYSKSAFGNRRNWKFFSGKMPCQFFTISRRIFAVAARNRCFASVPPHGFLRTFSSCQAWNRAKSSAGVTDEPLPCFQSSWKIPDSLSSQRSRSPNVPNSKCWNRNWKSLPVKRLGICRPSRTKLRHFQGESGSFSIAILSQRRIFAGESRDSHMRKMFF